MGDINKQLIDVFKRHTGGNVFSLQNTSLPTVVE